jgi:DNA-binding transcriptional MerR regulator
MAGQIFTKKQIKEALTGIVDIQDREIGYWTDLEIVVPDIANPKGRGYTRFYSFDNLLAFAVAKRMANAGLSLKAIKSAMEKIGELDFLYAGWFGHVRVVVTNPNAENVSVSVQLVKHKEAHKHILDMQIADTYFVIDVTDTIKRVYEIAKP